MRDAAHHVDTAIERCAQQFDGTGAAEITVLREGHQLQVEIGFDPFLHFKQRIDRQQSRIADVDMGADREQPPRHRPVAIAQGALHDRFLGEMGFQLAPEPDAFEQRARLVEPREP